MAHLSKRHINKNIFKGTAKTNTKLCNVKFFNCFLSLIFDSVIPFPVLCFSAATLENRCSHEKFKGKIHRFSLNCRFKTSLLTDRSIFCSKSVERT